MGLFSVILIDIISSGFLQVSDLGIHIEVRVDLGFSGMLSLVLTCIHLFIRLFSRSLGQARPSCQSLYCPRRQGYVDLSGE